MTNLASILAAADDRAEPSRLQPALFEGRQVVLQATLERTAVIVDGGVARLVRLIDLEVDADNLWWSPRQGLTQQELTQSARRGHRRPRTDRHDRPVEQVRT